MQSGMNWLNGLWQLRKVSKLGSRVRVTGNMCVKNWGTIYIGDNVQVDSEFMPVEFVTHADGNIHIGHHVYINRGTAIAALDWVEIGAHTLIGRDVSIMDNSFHHIDPDRRLETPKSARVTIGKNVWLGNRCMVMPGVTIGAHSVIGAGSIVTRDVPPRSVAVGIPAKVIKRI